MLKLIFRLKSYKYLVQMFVQIFLNINFRDLWSIQYYIYIYKKVKLDKLPGAK